MALHKLAFRLCEGVKIDKEGVIYAEVMDIPDSMRITEVQQLVVDKSHEVVKRLVEVVFEEIEQVEVTEVVTAKLSVLEGGKGD